MTESKQAVEEQQGQNPDSGKEQQKAASSRSRKPAPKAQVKPSQTKRPAKTPAFPSRSGASVSKMKANATRAEALEHENVAVQNKRSSHSHVDTTDVSGVIVPSDSEDTQQTPVASTFAEPEEKHSHKKDKGKHHSKDKKAHLLPTAGETNQQMDHDKMDPVKQLEVLQRKALKSEKKVNKLKKKVHKAEKKDIKPSKIRALKEKLTKAFAKWQRRKKKVEATQG